MHDKRFPNESAAYRAARDQLLDSELALRQQIEAVAAQRRALPLGGALPADYQLAGDGGAVVFSELFGAHDTLIVYSLMFGAADDAPCARCASCVDELAGAVHHLAQRASVVVIGQAPLARLRAFARSRPRWDALRIVSSAGCSFNRDYHAEDRDGSQRPMLHVFVRRGDAIHHTWSSELHLIAADRERVHHLDSMWALGNMLDCTPVGRGDFSPQLYYDDDFALAPSEFAALDDGSKLAVLEALVAAVYADGKLAAAEVAHFDRIVERMPWGMDPPVVRALITGTAARVGALATSEQVLAFVETVADRLPGQAIREHVVAEMARLAVADGQLNQLEKNMLGVFVVAFGLTPERVVAIQAAVRESSGS